MIEIREMRIDDLPQVAEIEKQIFSIPWSVKSFQESLESENTIYIVAIENEKILGYVGIYISFEEGNITNVAVSPNHRRKQIGQKLILKILEKSKQRGVAAVILEVRETNVAAISLYEKMGFVEAGIRKNFYEKPTENALIMWKYEL